VIIAIDGPAGSGKSTVARRAALQLGFHYLDTGAMYRALTVAALARGIAPGDAAALEDLARTMPLRFGYADGDPLPSKVFIGDVDVTETIRKPEVDRQVSEVSAHPAVREAMVDQQRSVAQSDSYVIEGRDIGTVVFPAAELKLFITASPEERARRRAAQNAERGLAADYDTILVAIRARDDFDSSREVAPLRPDDDALCIDTTQLSIDETVALVVDLAKETRG
jgi:cytidylate kinase